MKQSIRHEKAVLLVPRPGSHVDQDIDPGSGIVGVVHHGRFFLFYEGNRISAENLVDATDRVLCCFGRAATSYPTSAMRALLPEETGDVYRVGEVEWPNRITFDSPASKQMFDDYMSRYESKTPSSSGSGGWYGSKMVELDVRSFLGGYDDPRSTDEWKWIEAMSTFVHPGLFEFILRVRREEEKSYEADPPPRLKGVLEMIRKSGAEWVLFHQDGPRF